MIAAKELELMKEEALLINIGRGGTIDEQALIEVLALGKLAGVGLDVFQTEPLPASSSLWQTERVIITPHYAGVSPRYDDRAMEIFLDNLSRYRAGEALVNVVDQERGY
jgi:phosphoglycerate dehydrogenase-like enzyme